MDGGSGPSTTSGFGGVGTDGGVGGPGDGGVTAGGVEGDGGWGFGYGGEGDGVSFTDGLSNLGTMSSMSDPSNAFFDDASESWQVPNQEAYNAVNNGEGSNRNRFLQFIMRSLVARNPALSKTLGVLGIANNAMQGNTGKAALGLASMTVPGVGLAMGLGEGLTAINSLSQPTSAEGIAAAKSYSGPGANGASTANSGQSMNNILQGLAGLYMGNRYIKNMNNQYNTLSGMYGQDSPYAQTMRQKLERRDAAAGRRSQYGPREVELQAALAGQYGQNAGMMNTLNSNITQARMQQLMMLNKMLGGRQGIQDIFGGLQGLFGGGGGVNDWAQGGQGLEATLGDWGG